MKLTIGFSPCPNDTFIFDALVNGQILTPGIEWEPVLEDVQTLNEWATQGRLDVSKISYGVLPLALPHYQVIPAGGALGMGVGPLLIAKTPLHNEEDINHMRIAIPGIHTTAHVLFSLAYPEARGKQFLVFHEIEAAVLSGKVDAGVIIHENRFTYQQKGLVKLRDLGAYWEEKIQAPIPLGGIVVRRSLGDELASRINQWIQESLRWSWQQYPAIGSYTQLHAQEMSPEVMRQHIELYVNDYSMALGDTGKKSVETLLTVIAQQTGAQSPALPVFLPVS
ncbi:MAG TPA: 1,4-dihydroxy-6-naphthoate synthase [Sediminibacterium sp.]|nr:1,4-dihydroxy-6-naphthoate synthase [Sediminibacterium sp.]